MIFYTQSSELAELSNEVPIEKLATQSDLRTRKPSNNEEELDSWDALYNETGDLLRPDVLEEVNSSLLLLKHNYIKSNSFIYYSYLFLFLSSL